MALRREGVVVGSGRGGRDAKKANKKNANPHFRTTNWHSSIFPHQPGKHPSISSTADCELLSNAGFRWQALWSRISIALVSEVMGGEGAATTQ